MVTAGLDRRKSSEWDLLFTAEHRAEHRAETTKLARLNILMIGKLNVLNINAASVLFKNLKKPYFIHERHSE